MVLVFDLDDTLYEEITFVQSGFKEVAFFISQEFNLDYNDIYLNLLIELEAGRGYIFDNVLLKFGISKKSLISRCISVYRTHKPEIRLFDDALRCLNRFYNKIPLYLVTDGNKIVQYNKIKALEIESFFERIYITRRFGIKYEKPSPYCFEKICKRENTIPNTVFYIGDNPNKDFVGIKPLGFKTIRLMRGNYFNAKRPIEYDAHYQTETLDQITEELLLSI